ncbi:MAG: 3'-5' exonuclease domain-containing protein 2 [Bacteroidales bacterium]|nr:3'-5' exonuclease domain-containing protein 2 [Bacteroidales bacterium]
MKHDTPITEEEMNRLPRREFDGEIFLIDTLDKLDQAMPMLKGENLLGFDTETRPSFKKGKNYEVALLQLANADRAFLFRLNHIGIPDALKDLMGDPNVLKIGLALRDDLAGLKRLDHFEPAGFIDLQDMASENSVPHNGLKKLAAKFLNYRISKSRSKRLSNWEADRLGPKQVRYAATDAWVCYELYKVMKKL